MFEEGAGNAFLRSQACVIEGLIKKFRDLVSENYNLLLMPKNI